jgi:(1->4)-alpha-D-glucan 1-alpha-D-glucosylmutase
LNVLSEIPVEWALAVRRWLAMNSRHRQDAPPDRNAEYLYYQTLVGAWPVSEERAQAYLQKAAREAKEHTDWTRPNAPYENALRNFVSATLRDPEFIADLERFIGQISEAAAFNSLGQTLVKLTAPGVPDIYQGCELWDFSLVDPDNRRPVNFALRRNLLAAARSFSATEIWRRRAEGLPKLWLIQKTLNLRTRLPGFADLNYEPVQAEGPKSEHLTAFLRGGIIMTLVPRFHLKLNHDWQDTALRLPAGVWRHEFSGQTFEGLVRPAELFSQFPVALLVKTSAEKASNHT